LLYNLTSWKSIIRGVLALIERLLVVYVKSDCQLVVNYIINQRVGKIGHLHLAVVGNSINSD
jgi:hypothetical protein